MQTFQTAPAAPLTSDSTEHHDWRVSRVSTFQEMGGVIEFLVAKMAGLGYTEKDVFGTRLVLEEAICNAIKHGHRHDPEKVVEIRDCANSEEFLVQVEDQGPGFDPTRIPDARAPENLERPNGRGLLLMHYYAAWVRYNRKGNCVTFCIRPSAPAPAELTIEPVLNLGRI